MTDHLSDSPVDPDAAAGRVTFHDPEFASDGYGQEDYDDYDDDQYGVGVVDYETTETVGGARSRANRTASEVEGRTSWSYLILLGLLFVLLVLFSWACDDRSNNTAGAGPAATPDEVEGRPVRLAISIEDGVVVLSGNVPDEAAQGQVVTAAQAQYGAENVVDNLSIVAGSTMEGGTVSITGRAQSDDPRPQALRTAIVGDFGLEEAAFSVATGEAALVPVAVEATVTGEAVRLSGQLPDQQSIADLSAAAEEVWGQGNVDATGLTVGASTTWVGGTVRVSGDASLGFSADALPAAVQSRFGPEVTVDLEGVAVEAGPEALAELETQINTDLAAEPILFAPESSEIDDSSDAILNRIAEQLATVPGVAFEVVGHTDNVGPDDENQLLSEQRAEAVVTRLAELGIDESRMTSRGEGETNPIADNDDPAERSKNRRIEFSLVGAAEAAEDGETSEEESNP